LTSKENPFDQDEDEISMIKRYNKLTIKKIQEVKLNKNRPMKRFNSLRILF